MKHLQWKIYFLYFSKYIFSFLVDRLNDLLDKHVLDSQQVNLSEDDNEVDTLDEYVELPLPLSVLPSTPGTKRAYKGTSSVSWLYSPAKAILKTNIYNT